MRTHEGRMRAVITCTVYGLMDIGLAGAISWLTGVDFTFCLAMMVCGTANTALYRARK